MVIFVVAADEDGVAVGVFGDRVMIGMCEELPGVGSMLLVFEVQSTLSEGSKVMKKSNFDLEQESVLM